MLAWGRVRVFLEGSVFVYCSFPFFAGLKENHNFTNPLS